MVKKQKALPAGKLPGALLQKLLSRIGTDDEQVLLGPAVGEDAAVIRTGKRLLVAKTDPVTLASDLIGWYAVHVNANDIATRGAKPRWFMASVLLPAGSTGQDAEKIFEQISAACKSLEVSLVGGHTEITYDLKRPIVSGCMLAETDAEPVKTSGAMPGDDIILTKGVAIEGTAALAREARDRLIEAGIAQPVIDRAASYLFQPGISIVKEALIAARFAVHCMHDPTEGGLATGLLEIAAAAGVGLRIDEDAIAVLPECRAICHKLKLRPAGLLASGALLITLPPAGSAGLLRELERAGISAGVIGRVVAAAEGCRMLRGSRYIKLPEFKRDELARFLEGQDLEV